MGGTPRKQIVALEALRGFAALYVLLHHALPIEAMHPLVALPFRFGQEAVILFFLVSGYVIHYSWPGSLKQYAMARFFRIYPIFLAALALSYICASVAAGEFLSPDFQSLAGNLLMLQDRAREGSIVTPYMGNEPLWSLSYEVFFYIVYVVALKTGRPHLFGLAVSLAGLVAMLLFPFQGFRFLAYLMIWWIGVGFAEVERKEGGPLIAALSCTAAATAFFAWSLWSRAKAGAMPATFGDFPILELRHFGSAVVFSLALLIWRRLRLKEPEWALTPFLIVAPISYALYAVHYPLLVSGIHPVAAVALAFVLAFLLERYSAKLNRLVRSRASRKLADATGTP